jgi:pyrroloquinoline quinone biosynthesis protein D
MRSITQPFKERRDSRPANQIIGMVPNDATRPALARGVRLKADSGSGELVLLFPEGVLHLSETAEAVVRQCDGSASVEQIIKALAEEYDAAPDVLRQDVLDCLAELGGRKLIVW